MAVDLFVFTARHWEEVLLQGARVWCSKECARYCAPTQGEYMEIRTEWSSLLPFKSWTRRKSQYACYWTAEATTTLYFYPCSHFNPYLCITPCSTAHHEYPLFLSSWWEIIALRMACEFYEPMPDEPRISVARSRLSLPSYRLKYVADYHNLQSNRSVDESRNDSPAG